MVVAASTTPADEGRWGFLRGFLATPWNEYAAFHPTPVPCYLFSSPMLCPLFPSPNLLKHQLQAELNVTGTLGREDSAKGGRTEEDVGQIEIGPVEKIEELGSKLQS